MNKFYPTMARAVAHLDGDGNARHALYERARAALINQLKARDPLLNEAKMERERLELEEAIALVEADTTKRRQEALHPKTASVARAPNEPRPKQQDIPPLEKAASMASRKPSVNLSPSQRPEEKIRQSSGSEHDARPATLSADQRRQELSETRHASADAVTGSRLSSRLQSMIEAARQIGLMVAKPTPRQPQAPQPNSLSAAAVPDASPSHELSVPPLAKAASAAPRMQPLNLARSQGPEKKIAEKTAAIE